MYFSTLRYSYDSDTGKQIAKIENKQRITLSDRAVSTLLSDLGTFNGFDQEYLSVKDIPSADVNSIFRAFCRDAESSVCQKLSIEAASLEDSLKSICSPEMLTQIINALLKKRREQLKETAKERSTQKGNEYYFRISKENQDYLATDQAQEEADVYNDNIGHYFKAVLEEYCSLPYVLREQYYFQHLIRSIHVARNEHRLVKAKLYSINRKTKRHNIKYVKPYDVRQDSEGLYNYLVGMMSDSPSGPWAVASIRLTSILKLDNQGSNVTLAQNKQNAIEDAIRTKGVQYLSDDKGQERIVVQFTQRGEKMYKSMLHLRPQYRKKKDGHIYEFECSAYQARTYFFKFGKDASILKPAFLANEFRDGYVEALRNYEDRQLMPE